MNKLKIGVLGFAHTHVAGFIDSFAAREDVEIVGIAEDNREYTAPYDSQYRYYEDYNQLLAEPIDAVLICSENVRHAELTIAAARMGKHVFCEKPLGTTREDMEQMVAVCRENKVQLMVAFSNRYVQSVVRAKEVIDRGELGDIIAVHATNKGSLPKRTWFTEQQWSGGGALLDHSVHVIDLLNWMLSSTVVEVYAEADTLFHDIAIDDTGMLHFKYENGVIGVLDTSWSRASSFPMRRDLTLDIIGTRGSLTVDVRKQINEVYSDKAGRLDWSDWSDNLNDLVIGDFVDSLLAGKDVPISGEDGLRSTIVALAAYESVRSCKPVSIC